MMGARVVVIGGAVAGLAAGLALADHGAEVVIVERDPVTERPGTDPRRGVPQARHAHAFLALGRAVLQTRAPRVWAALLTAGAREVPCGGRLTPDGSWVAAGDDPELVGLGCRRVVLEAALRRVALDDPRITWRDGTEVTGLMTAPGRDVPVVTGVTTSRGDLAADLVVDASGRASALLGWLGGAGARPPAEWSESCGIVYFSRFYRLCRYPEATLNRGVASGGFGPTSACVVIPGDDDTLQVVLGLPPGDAALRSVANEQNFDAAARLHPFASDWFEPGVVEPISGVAPMTGLRNRLRRFVIDGEPIIEGLLPVGDSVATTDPAYGRGMSLALVHAFATAEAVAAGLDDRHRLAVVADQLTDRLVRPWFDDSVAGDRARSAAWRGLRPPPTTTPTLADVMAASERDAGVWRATMRRFNLLDPPDALFADQAVLAAVRDNGPTPAPVGPSRDDFLHAGPRGEMPPA